MFWDWLLKYSSFLITGAVSFLVGYLLWFFTTKRADLIFYVSHTQWVPIPRPQGQPTQAQPLPANLGTSTLYLQNQGKAPARDVLVGHFGPLPSLSVFPDFPRDIINLPNGGQAIHFPLIPPATLIIISYLLLPPVTTLDQIVSYVTSQDGPANRIPVMLQRIWPNWFNRSALVLFVAGLWVVVNAAWSLTKFLWIVYYH